MHLINTYSREFIDLLNLRTREAIEISEVFFVACGGSLVDLYAANFFLASESSKLRSNIITANEFVHVTPKVLGKGSVVVICTHSGKTPELVEATKVAKDAGALTITLTHNPASQVAHYSDLNIVYEWGDDSSVQNNPMAIALALGLEVFRYTEGYEHYDKFQKAFLKINDIVSEACNKVKDRVLKFAETYQNEKLFYILSSGASFGHAYGFAICSLMEMQWLNASAVHSGEFFHGPFEITDKQTNFIVLVNEGRTRPLDLRVITFLEKYTNNYVVIDARELGMNLLPDKVVESFNPILFYSVLCEYRKALAEIRDHPLETRRYMGKVEY